MFLTSNFSLDMLRNYPSASLCTRCPQIWSPQDHVHFQRFDSIDDYLDHMTDIEVKWFKCKNIHPDYVTEKDWRQGVFFNLRARFHCSMWEEELDERLKGFEPRFKLAARVDLLFLQGRSEEACSLMVHSDLQCPVPHQFEIDYQAQSDYIADVEESGLASVHMFDPNCEDLEVDTEMVICGAKTGNFEDHYIIDSDEEPEFVLTKATKLEEDQDWMSFDMSFPPSFQPKEIQWESLPSPQILNTQADFIGEPRTNNKHLDKVSYVGEGKRRVLLSSYSSFEELLVLRKRRNQLKMLVRMKLAANFNEVGPEQLAEMTFVHTKSKMSVTCPLDIPTVAMLRYLKEISEICQISVVPYSYEHAVHDKLYFIGNDLAFFEKEKTLVPGEGVVILSQGCQKFKHENRICPKHGALCVLKGAIVSVGHSASSSFCIVDNPSQSTYTDAWVPATAGQYVRKQSHSKKESLLMPRADFGFSSYITGWPVATIKGAPPISFTVRQKSIGYSLWPVNGVIMYQIGNGNIVFSGLKEDLWLMLLVHLTEKDIVARILFHLIDIERNSLITDVTLHNFFPDKRFELDHA